MNMRRAVMPFVLGFFKHKGTWRRTSGSLCEFKPYGFPETSKKEEDKPSKIYRRFEPRLDSFIKFSTANVCPAVVIVSPEKGNGGSGIIIDSNGTVLTHARNIFFTEFQKTSSQNEVDEEGNLMLVDEEFISTVDYGNFSLGLGGPIATLHGEVVVGISTEIDIIYPLRYSGSYGTINAMGIEEALSKVGYPKKKILEIINR